MSSPAQRVRPRFKKKNPNHGSFRLRNKTSRAKDGTIRSAMRIGDADPRSVTLPGIGALRVREDTRPLRQLLATGRGRVLFAPPSPATRGAGGCP
ncbi:hypothetical protein ACIPY2_09595 [Paenarthrobacter sp. NPDC089675]|uniref:hypothetical protein n=1 Tax=Paenarthrobacter sp. NPDC089675 TaxID=3364376 RepID=UPI00380BCE7E